MIKLDIPISEDKIRQLKNGDVVALSGIMVTARDAAHKYMVETFIDGQPSAAEKPFQPLLTDVLREGVIYHCGPVVKKTDGGWEFISAGPTTSNREEIYEHKVIRHFNVRAIIGKGGMGAQTLQALQECGAVYLHAIGGAGALAAKSVVRVLDLIKPEFGLPEAFWKIEVKDFVCTVTMDSHGHSLHQDVLEHSRKVWETFIA